jgi:hypothetical protein
MVGKRFFFEKKAEPLANQKTFFMLELGLWPIHVMAGLDPAIHA